MGKHRIAIIVPYLSTPNKFGQHTFPPYITIFLRTAVLSMASSFLGPGTETGPAGSSVIVDFIIFHTEDMKDNVRHYYNDILLFANSTTTSTSSSSSSSSNSKTSLSTESLLKQSNIKFINVGS